MKWTFALLGLATLALTGCAGWAEYVATAEGQAAIQAAIDDGTAIAVAVIPPPFDLLVPGLGAIIGGFFKKELPE